jgi:hypothetical protein
MAARGREKADERDQGADDAGEDNVLGAEEFHP